MLTDVLRCSLITGIVAERVSGEYRQGRPRCEGTLVGIAKEGES